jgi:hypothetical protein
LFCTQIKEGCATKVQLIRSEDNSPVEAYITELAQKHIDDYENLWRESLRTFQTEDKFWDWLFKLEFIQAENHSGYAIDISISLKADDGRDTVAWFPRFNW